METTYLYNVRNDQNYIRKPKRPFWHPEVVGVIATEIRSFIARKKLRVNWPTLEKPKELGVSGFAYVDTRTKGVLLETVARMISQPIGHDAPFQQPGSQQHRPASPIVESDTDTVPIGPQQPEAHQQLYQPVTRPATPIPTRRHVTQITSNLSPIQELDIYSCQQVTRPATPVPSTRRGPETATRRLSPIQEIHIASSLTPPRLEVPSSQSPISSSSSTSSASSSSSSAQSSSEKSVGCSSSSISSPQRTTPDLQGAFGQIASPANRCCLSVSNLTGHYCQNSINIKMFNVEKAIRQLILSPAPSVELDAPVSSHPHTPQRTTPDLQGAIGQIASPANRCLSVSNLTGHYRQNSINIKMFHIENAIRQLMLSPTPLVELDAPVSNHPHTPLVSDFCELPGLEFTVPSPHPSVSWAPLESSRPLTGSTQLAHGGQPVAAIPWPPVQVEVYIDDQGYKVPQAEISVCDPEDISFITNADGNRWRLGAGSFGSVEGANLTKEDGSIVKVAVKSFFLNNLAPFVREARLQAYLSDTGVFPKFHGVLQLTEGPNTVICQVSELFAGGKTLQNLLVDIQASGLHLDFEWVAIALQLATGLQTIHKHGVIYNDLKEDNVLVNVSVVGRPVLRYIDIGLATFNEGLAYGLPEEAFERCPHIAPEVRKGEHSTFLSDIWSLGRTLANMAEATDIEGLRRVARMAHRVDPAERSSLEKIISSMLAINPG